MKRKAFTYLEMLIVVGIFVAAFSLGSMSLGYFFNSNVMNAAEDTMVSHLRFAKTYSEMRVEDSNWGVYFYDNPSGVDSVTLFKGSTYASRDTAYDELYEFPGNLVYTNIVLNGGGSEVIFSMMSGETMNYGDVTLQNDIGQSLNININQYGQIIPS